MGKSTKKNFFQNLLNSIDSQVLVNAENKRKRLIFYFFVVLCIFTLLLFTISALLQNNYLPLLIDGVAFLLAIFFLWLSLSDVPLEVTFRWITATLFVFLQLLFFFGGANGAAALWALVFPVVCVFLNGQKFGIILSVIFLFLTQMSYFFIELWGGFAYSGNFRFRFVGVYVLLLFFILSYEFSHKQAQYYLARFAKRLKLTVKLLSQRQKQHHTIMNHISDGLLLLDENLIIQKNYSRYVEKIFYTQESLAGKKESLAGKNFFELLRGKTFAAILFRAEKFLNKLVLQAKERGKKNTDEKIAGENKIVQKKLSKKDNPLLKVQLQGCGAENEIKTLYFSFSIIHFHQNNFEIMVRIRDITEKEKLRKKLKSEKNIRKQEGEIIYEALEANNLLLKMFLDMVTEKDQLLAKLENKLKTVSPPEKNAGLTAENSGGNATPSSETANPENADISKNVSPLDTTPLAPKNSPPGKSVNETTKIIENILSVMHSLKGNASISGFTTSANIIHHAETELKQIHIDSCDHQQTNEDLVKAAENAENIVKNIRQHIDHWLTLVKKISNFEKGGEQENEDLDVRWIIGKTLESYNVTAEKKITATVNCQQFSGENLKKLPKKDQLAILDVVVQLVKNSLIHGFNDSFVKTGITPEISVKNNHHQGSLIITYADNGKGIDWKKIKNKEGQQLSREQAIEKIFTTNYSLSAQTNVHAGNGLGMSMIKKIIENLHGTLFLPEKESGFEIQLRLPYPANAE